MHKAEHDGSPLVMPQAWCGCSLAVAGSIEAFGKKVIGEFARLGEAIDALAYLKVDPTIMHKVLEVVFLDELLGNVVESYPRVLELLERSVEVEVLDVKSGKPGARLREDTVDEELDKFKGASGCADITRVTDAIATYGDACAVGVILLGAGPCSWSNVITRPCMEVPGVACAGLVVNKIIAASWANRSGIVVEWPIEVLPG